MTSKLKFDFSKKLISTNVIKKEPLFSTANVRRLVSVYQKLKSHFSDLHCQLISCWFVYIRGNLPIGICEMDTPKETFKEY